MDESGSMHGERISYAKLTELILYDFCKALKIPHACYGQRTEGNTVILDSYAEFSSIDENDMYRIMSVHARGENRDGYALRYACEMYLMNDIQFSKIHITIRGGSLLLWLQF